VQSNTKKYLSLLEDLKLRREQEQEILDKMDLIWQALTHEERMEVRELDPTWPPPPPSVDPKSKKGSKK